MSKNPIYFIVTTQVLKLAISSRFWKTLRFLLLRVSIIDLMTAKFLAPLKDRNCPDIFCLTLMFLIALSEALLSGGTS